MGEEKDSSVCFHIPKGVLVAESKLFRNVLRDRTKREYRLPEETPEHFGLVQHFLLRHDLPFNIDSHVLRAVSLLACSLGIKRLETLLLDRLVAQFTEDTRAFVVDASCLKIPPQDQLESLIDANIPAIELDIRIMRHLDYVQTAPHRLHTLWRRTPDCHELLLAKTQEIPSLEDLPRDWKEAFAVWAHKFLKAGSPGDRLPMGGSPTTTGGSVGRKHHAPFRCIQPSNLESKARSKDAITKQIIRKDEVAVQEIKSEISKTEERDHIYIYLSNGIFTPFRLIPKKKSGIWLEYPISEGFHIELDQVTLETGGLYVAAIEKLQKKVTYLRFTEADDVAKFFNICQCKPIQRSE